MKSNVVSALSLMAVASPAISQINTAVADSEMKPFFDRANECLNAFDKTAKAKRLSVDNYKAAIDGVCVSEIRGMRGLYSLHLESSENQEYLVERLDKNIEAARASMVTAYIMK